MTIIIEIIHFGNPRTCGHWFIFYKNKVAIERKEKHFKTSMAEYM